MLSRKMVHILGLVKLGQNLCSDKRYFCTFKSVEAGVCTYPHILGSRLWRLVCAVQLSIKRSEVVQS